MPDKESASLKAWITEADKAGDEDVEEQIVDVVKACDEDVEVEHTVGVARETGANGEARGSCGSGRTTTGCRRRGRAHVRPPGKGSDVRGHEEGRGLLHQETRASMSVSGSKDTAIMPTPGGRSFAMARKQAKGASTLDSNATGENV